MGKNKAISNTVSAEKNQESDAGTNGNVALEADYGFASVASDVDLRDLDAVRRNYIASLQEMGRTLDLLLKNTAFFAGRK